VTDSLERSPLPTPDQIKIFNRLIEAARLFPETELGRLGLLAISLMADADRQVKYLDVSKLDAEMIRITEQSYQTNAAYYGMRYELSAEMVQTTYEDYLKEFLDRLGPLNGERRILIPGSGMGRDAIIISGQGYRVEVIDSSKAMTDSTRALLTGRDIIVFNADIRQLQRDVFPHFDRSYKGILAESMFEHLNKDDVRSLVKDFWKLLVKEGVLLFRLKLSNSGKAYKVIDGIGERYFTSWTLAEIDELKNEMRETGYEVLEVAEPLAQHIDSIHEAGKEGVVSKPPFYTIMAKKKS